MPSFSVSCRRAVTRKQAGGRDARQARGTGLRWRVPTQFHATKALSLQSTLLQESRADDRMRRLEGAAFQWLDMRVHVALPALPALQRPTLLVTFRAHSCKWWSHGRRRLFGGTRPPQMEARMVSADTPGRAGATRTVLGALFVELGAALVPELVASTRSRSCIAVVAGPAGQRASRGRARRGCVYEAGHGWQQLGIPRGTRAFYN
jgi:hypothetical protein